MINWGAIPVKPVIATKAIKMMIKQYSTMPWPLSSLSIQSKLISMDLTPFDNNAAFFILSTLNVYKQAMANPIPSIIKGAKANREDKVSFRKNNPVTQYTSKAPHITSTAGTM